MTISIDSTIGAIVTEDFRAAAVFHRHDIDFCCRGGRSLDQACQEQGLDASAVLAEITATRASSAEAPDFGAWDAHTLMVHIVSRHHAYVRGTLPSIVAHAEKIARAHGERYPELIEVAGLVEAVAAEMSAHMLKEEHILFPHIEALAAAMQQGCPPPPSPFGTIDNPIRLMETEHQSAGDAMARIRQLTRGYQVPDDGCTTYRVAMQELDAFEQDLHAHVHLENNILFPKARQLEGGEESGR